VNDVICGSKRWNDIVHEYILENGFFIPQPLIIIKRLSVVLYNKIFMASLILRVFSQFYPVALALI